MRRLITAKKTDQRTQQSQVPLVDDPCLLVYGLRLRRLGAWLVAGSFGCFLADFGLALMDA